MLTTRLILYAIEEITKMSTIPLQQRVVPETYAQLLFDYIEARNLRPEIVLGEPWPVATSERAGIDIDMWQRMMERAALELDDPLLGLHLGQTVSVQHLGIVGAILLASNTFSQALERLRRYQRLIFDATPIRLHTGDGWMEVLWDISEYLPGQLVEMTGYTVMVQFTRSLIRGTVNPIEVRFAHAAAGDPKDFETFFGCPVAFERPDPGLRFSLELLQQPLKSPDPALIALLEQHANERLAALPAQVEIIDQVRRAIAHILREGEPGIDKISAQLNCSPRTLQRRLGDAGSSFRYELNLVRHELAVSYLHDSRLQIVDIALLLGYSEHSAFTRAFKEWTGCTPQQVRQGAEIKTTP
ncbi:MAG: AraC family transcriptional regulator [Pseudomonadales bacterium]|nr:AraC family transcriptional regulator [Pseudomonadales bacterium]